MEVPALLLALQAIQEGALDRAELPRLMSILDTWQRSGLEVSCAELLTREFRIDPARVRRWEEKLSGRASRRIGKYLLRRRIGQGGMGVVFEAEHPNFERPVALKILAPQLGREPAAVQGFLREVKSAGRFNHPNIVHAYDAGIDGDLPYLVMEFVDGENLFQVLQREGPLDPARATVWLLEAARALSMLEATGWIHGDGKPSNWIVAPSGSLKLADLGLCRPPGRQRDGETLYGTPPYVAPEELTPSCRIDSRSDIYSLGATFFHLLTGRPPYEARTFEELRTALAEGPPPRLAELRPDLPEDLVSVIEDTLRPDPDGRPAGCLALVDRLEAVCRAHGYEIRDTAEGLSRPQPVRTAPAQEEKGARSPVALLLRVLIAVVLAMILVVVGLRFINPGETPHDGGAGDGIEEGGGATVTIEKPPDPAAGQWQALWEAESRDYAAVFGWLERPEASHPELERWRTEAVEALEEEAGGLWAACVRHVEGELLPARSYSVALAVLEEFPERLRVARLRVAHDELGRRVVAARQQRLTKYLIELRTVLAAEDAGRARAVLRRVRAEPATEVSWYQQRLVESCGGFPWVELELAAVSEFQRVRAERRQSALRELAAGRVPASRLEPGQDLVLELALAFLARHPGLLHDAAPWRERFLDAGLLAVESPALLELVLGLVGDAEDVTGPSVAQEAEAARLWGAVRSARGRWDSAATAAAWAALAAAELADTVAARRAAVDLDAQRARLRRGVFLRSDVFVAEVSGDWGMPPRLRYDFASRRPFAEWRSRHSSWRRVSGGHAPRVAGLATLECIVPFDRGVRLDVELSLPPEPWTFAIQYDTVTVGLARTQPGELRVVAGDAAQVEKALTSGAGFWPAGAVAFGKPRVRLSLVIDEQEVALTVDASTLRFPMLDRLTTGWLALRVPGRMVIHEVTLEGEPNPVWLDARRAYLEAQEH